MLAIVLIVIIILLLAGYTFEKNNILWNYQHNVYISTHGDCYHLPNCHYIEGSVIKAESIERAKEKGFAPCSYCKPDRILTQEASEYEKDRNSVSEQGKEFLKKYLENKGKKVYKPENDTGERIFLDGRIKSKKN